MDSKILHELKEHELVTMSQQGDRAAFGELYARLHAMVYAVALGCLRNQADASDMVQEVFSHALECIGQLRQPEAFHSWLRRMTLNMIANRVTRKRLPVLRDDAALDQPGREKDPVDIALGAELETLISNGLAQLKEADREVLVRFYLRGQSLNLIASETADPLGTIKRRLHFARKRLAKAMSQSV